MKTHFFCGLVFLLWCSAAFGDSGVMVKTHSKWRNSLKPKGQTAPAVILASSGKANYPIVLSAAPTTMDEKAAADLAVWLKEMTGAEFPVVKESAGTAFSGKIISIGKTARHQISKIPKPRMNLGRDGYAIDVKDGSIFITGGSKRGVINGVYSLLEEDLGCRWYAPQTQTIPSRPTLRFTPVSRSYRPPLEDRRSPYYADVWDIDWSLRNRTYCSAAPVKTQWGGHPRIWGFVHTFNALLPPDEYFKDHPEYFSELNGQRRPMQWCMTNPDVLRITKDKVREILKSAPDTEFVEVSPNDWQDYCECTNCKKIIDEEGTYMGPLLWFLNQVADSIKDDYPNAKINTLAYLGTVVPPKNIKPRENVSFWLCTDSYAWSRPNEFAWETEKFAKSIEGWGKVKANIIIWDYPSSFRYMTPNLNMPVHQANLKYYIKNGATGVMYQCAHDVNYAADHSFLRSWVWAKQLWDPSRDTRALMRDFNFGYYGAVAPYLQKYDDMLWDAWKLVYKRRTDKTPPNPVDKAFVARGWDLMKQAEAAASGDTELTRRVKVAQMPLMYVKATYGPGTDFPAYAALLDDFEKTARAAGAKYIENAFQGPDIDKQFAFWRKLADTKPENVNYLELPNQWNFAIDPDNKGIEGKWFAEDFDDSGWANVRSDTGNGWESQGFKDYHGYAWYRMSGDIPADVLSVEGLKLLFLAVDEQAEVYINGQKAYEHTVASTGRSVEILWTEPFMFDPKPFVKQGSNTLAVRVHDTMGMGGIWKPVYIAWGSGVDPAIFEEVVKIKKQSGY